MSRRKSVDNSVGSSPTVTTSSTSSSTSLVARQEEGWDSCDGDGGGDAVSVVSSVNSSLSSTSSQGNSSVSMRPRKQRRARGAVQGGVAASAADVRLRYLRRLGINDGKVQGKIQARPLSGEKVAARTNSPVRGNVNDDQNSLSCRLSKTVVLQEPLKHDHRRSLPCDADDGGELSGKETKPPPGSEEVMSPWSSPSNFSATSCASSSVLSTSSQSERAPSKPKKRVSFNSTVAVKPIPMRTEYSDRIRCHLWSSRREMLECVQRNSLEFASENYDWRQAAEDVDMLVCTETGALIHPIHYLHYLQQQAQPSCDGLLDSKKDRNRGNISFFHMSQHASMEWIN